MSVTDHKKVAMDIAMRFALDLSPDLHLSTGDIYRGRLVERIVFALQAAQDEAYEDVAKCCDESEAEGTRLRDEVPPQRGEPQEQERLRISRTSWVNTARSLASEIRARKMKAAEGGG